MIANGSLGKPIAARLPLVIELHDVIAGKLASGGSYYSAKGSIAALRMFYSWADEMKLSPSLKSAADHFRDWSDYLLHAKISLHKLTFQSIYTRVGRVASLLDEALDSDISLLATTRIRRKRHAPALGLESDKQRLDQSFAFGQMLLDIIDALSVDAIRGPLPVLIKFRRGTILEEWSRLRPEQSVESLKGKYGDREKRVSIEKRAAYVADTTIRTRHPLVNLRIEAEMLIFIAQTGMNLAQAHKIKVGAFRYHSHANGYQVQRVYKNRRQGEIEFTIYSQYRPIFERYLKWRCAIFPDDPDGRLFPHCSAQRRSPEIAPAFSAIRKRCERLNVTYVGPRLLRRTRVNWLMRHSGDESVTAEMSQHTRETLLANYLRPNHQVAVAEISRFHKHSERIFAAPGPGVCANPHAGTFSDIPAEAPKPDCISPAGCLFCRHQRDIDNADHIWSLVSYRQLKYLELALYRPPENSTTGHPIKAVLDILAAKIAYFRGDVAKRSNWVDEAEALVQEGTYHPKWDGFIRLLETLP
uniref:site-specific integrase n=1 Tax=Cupriavidus taiwanensis TaxID=164546 RepID=UPI0011C0714E|nr:site-specific integrase [Cupriavidus taiwanensis]